MDGAKPTTDTIDNPKGCDRQASCLDRILCVSIGGPSRNEDPGGSKILAE